LWLIYGWPTRALSLPQTGEATYGPAAFDRAILSSLRCKFGPKPLEFALFFEPVSVREQNRRITHYEANISA
jgi:hypothetical protein